MNEILLGALCLSQAVQGCVLVWVVVRVRSHDQVITGLPGLLTERDKVLIGETAKEIRKEVFDALSEHAYKQAEARALGGTRARRREDTAHSEEG